MIAVFKKKMRSFRSRLRRIPKIELDERKVLKRFLCFPEKELCCHYFNRKLNNMTKTINILKNLNDSYKIEISRKGKCKWCNDAHNLYRLRVLSSQGDEKKNEEEKEVEEMANKRTRRMNWKKILPKMIGFRTEDILGKTGTGIHALKKACVKHRYSLRDGKLSKIDGRKRQLIRKFSGWKGIYERNVGKRVVDVALAEGVHSVNIRKGASGHGFSTKGGVIRRIGERKIAYIPTVIKEEEVVGSLSRDNVTVEIRIRNYPVEGSVLEYKYVNDLRIARNLLGTLYGRMCQDVKESGKEVEKVVEEKEVRKEFPILETVTHGYREGLEQVLKQSLVDGKEFSFSRVGSIIGIRSIDKWIGFIREFSTRWKEIKQYLGSDKKVVIDGKTLAVSFR